MDIIHGGAQMRREMAAELAILMFHGHRIASGIEALNFRIPESETQDTPVDH